MAKAILLVLTRVELEAARLACANATECGRAKTAADTARDGALAQIFFKMGMSLDVVKAMDPAELSEAIELRVGKAFKLDGDAFGEFAVQKTSQGKYPSWKKELVALSGPAAAVAIEGKTKVQYSYAVIASGLATPGSSSVFVLAPLPELKGKAKAASAK